MLKVERNSAHIFQWKKEADSYAPPIADLKARAGQFISVECLFDEMKDVFLYSGTRHFKLKE